MKAPTVDLIIIMCLMSSGQVCGADVEMRIHRGDDVTLRSDCVWETGLDPVWFQNCSDTLPPVVMFASELMRHPHPHYAFVWNPSSQTHDLLVKNVTASIACLYYCALHKKKIGDEKSHLLTFKDVYRYGKTTIRLALLDTEPNTTPVPAYSTCPNLSSPVSDCSVCWKLLFSVCPVCVLLHVCVRCFCSRNTEGSEKRRGLLTENLFQVSCVKEHQCVKSMNGELCYHTEVSYTPLISTDKSE